MFHIKNSICKFKVIEWVCFKMLDFQDANICPSESHTSDKSFVKLTSFVYRTFVYIPTPREMFEIRFMEKVN